MTQPTGNRVVNPTDQKSDNKLPLVAACFFLLIGTLASGYVLGSLSHSPAPTPIQNNNTSLVALQQETDKAPTLRPNKAEVLHLGENTIADIAESAGKSVVSIEVGGSQLNSAAQSFQLPGSVPANPGKIRIGSGAGVIYKSNGYILTSFHLIRVADEYKVTLQDKRTFSAKLVGRDTFSDLAVLKIDAEDLPAATFADSSKVRPGDWAIAIGSPLRLVNSVSLGIVSALHRDIGSPTTNVDFIQTDAAINPGNSGGPILNLRGEVIGITAIVRRDAQNIGFAVPSNLAVSIASKILSAGMVEHNYIGIRMNEVAPGNAKKGESKVIVMSVLPASPAMDAGLESNDVIETVDGRSVHTRSEMIKFIQDCPKGEKLNILISRRGHTQMLLVETKKMLPDIQYN